MMELMHQKHLTDPYYSYAVNAKTENCYVRYVIDPYFEDTPGFGATAAEDEKYERSFVGVYEKEKQRLYLVVLKAMKKYYSV